MKKPERPQKMVSALIKSLTDAAYLGVVSAVVDAGVLVDISDTNMVNTHGYTQFKKWKQQPNILLMSSLNTLLLLISN